MKKILLIALAAFAAYYFIYSKSSHCENMDDLKNKGLELVQAFVHAASDKDSDIDLESLMLEIKKIELMKSNGTSDIQLACEAMDDIMDKLD